MRREIAVDPGGKAGPVKPGRASGDGLPTAVASAVSPISPGGHGIRLVRYYRGERPRWPERATLTARDPGPSTAVGHAWRPLKRFLIGNPIPSTQAVHERLTRVNALAVLSSDAISSVAYGPEAAPLALSAAGAGARVLNLPISAAIALLLIVVTFSYRQTIFAYPSSKIDVRWRLGVAAREVTEPRDART